ncbi:MAG TPA: hypothetical protein VF629_13615 [Hymenobacter sp.]|jgi:hypothetical protein|uniref:hypothetical protein n=1 Tax=Hymenobacter sp. TaxID=1898978 RepID=UPI002EDAAA59
MRYFVSQLNNYLKIMTKNPLRCIALGLLMLCACKKENSEESLPTWEGIYESEPTILSINPIIMYTANGAVNSQNTIEKFIRRNLLLTSPLFSSTNTPNPSGESYTLTIMPNNQATIAYKHPLISGSVSYAIASRSRERLHLLSVDSTSNNLFINANRCTVLNQNVPAVSTPARCIPGSPGVTLFCKFRTSKLISVANGQLFAPQLSWYVKLQQSPNAYCSSGYGGSWNIFNQSVTNQLMAGDTILVQERAFAFRKK